MFDSLCHMTFEVGT